MTPTERFSAIWATVSTDVGLIHAAFALIASHWKTFGVVFLVGLVVGLYLGW